MPVDDLRGLQSPPFQNFFLKIKKLPIPETIYASAGTVAAYS
jgi:hypothetical protein